MTIPRIEKTVTYIMYPYEGEDIFYKQDYYGYKRIKRIPKELYECKEAYIVGLLRRNNFKLDIIADGWYEDSYTIKKIIEFLPHLIDTAGEKVGIAGVYGMTERGNVIYKLVGIADINEG